MAFALSVEKLTALSRSGTQAAEMRFVHPQEFLLIHDPICYHEWTSGEQVYTLRGHSGAVNSVAFSTDGTRMISGGRDKLIKIWDAENGKEVQFVPFVH